MSIDKIHVNFSTKISLNDRFTVMQSVGPKVPPIRKISRRRTQSASLDSGGGGSGGGGGPQTASLANRKLLEQLEKKHKIQAALKLKRRSLKANLPTRQRLQNRIGLKKGTINAIRLAPNGKLTRSNSLSNIATMKADLIEPTLRRSNSTSNIAARLGARRGSTAKGGAQISPNSTRRRLKRNSLPIARSSSRQRLSRSNSVGNLKRSNSRSNLRRGNSKTDLNGSAGDVSVPPAKRINRNRFRSSSRSRRGSISVSSRLGVKRGSGGGLRDRPIRGINRRRIIQGGVARGRIGKRRNSTSNMPSGSKGGAQQGRVSRPRGRGGAASQRSRSRSKSRNTRPRSRSLHRNLGRGGIRQRNSRGGGRVRGRGGRGRGITRPLGAPRNPIKKEDLDKELDQYMANTKTALDKEMDVFMNSSL